LQKYACDFFLGIESRWRSRSGWGKAAGIGAADIGLIRKVRSGPADAAAMENRRRHDET
jgi:hypothetical protein